jgi:AAA domain-containing protein
VNITRGVRHPPARMVVFGPPGVGKSTFACAAPEVLALDYEQGLDEIGPARVQGGETWDASMKLVREACTAPGGHRTVVVDTIDRLEDQATLEVCREGKKKSLSDFGYGDGYEAVATKWRELLFVLESARAHGREVILVAHVQSKIQDDPMLGKYDKFIAALSKRCWGATHRWADAVLFANYEQGLIEGRAIMTGSRVLYTSAGTGYDAKNRWGLPTVLPLSWGSFASARASLARTADEVRASIRSLATDADAKAKAEDYMSKAGEDVPRLVSIETALRKKVTA